MSDDKLNKDEMLWQDFNHLNHWFNEHDSQYPKFKQNI